ncbi:unnamed protein product [Urochloa humidicola]
MASYQSLLSLSPADWIGAGGEFDVDDNGGGGHDREEAAAAAAAVSSYLSFDSVAVAGDEEGFYHQPPEAAAALHDADQQVPETLLLDTLQADYYYASGGVAGTGSSSEGQPGKQSCQADASALSSEPHDNGFIATTSAGASAGSPLLPLPAATAARTGGGGNRKVAFKTRSEVEVLDDGYRWRKYGKKLVKNSPNPRNYYRCSTEGCAVKKRVERARDDASFVITTYDGVHNHPAAPSPAPHHPCLRDYRLVDPTTTTSQQSHRGDDTAAPDVQEQ